MSIAVIGRAVLCRSTRASLALLVAIALLAPIAVRAQAEIKPEARGLFKQAMDFHRAQDPARAIDVFLKAYAIDPAVLSLPTEGLLDAGIKHFRAQLDVKKDDTQFLYRLAELYNLRGDLPTAIKIYRRVAQLAPNSPLAQVASDEVKKLEGFASSAPAAGASPSPAGSPGQASPEPGQTSKKEKSDPRLADAEIKVKELEDSLKKQKEENGQVREELDKLKEDYAKLKEDYDKAKYYQTLYFANPRNVDLLRQRKIKD